MAGLDASFEIHEIQETDTEYHQYELFRVDIVVPYIGLNRVNVYPTEDSVKYKTYVFDLKTGSLYNKELHNVWLTLSLTEKEKARIAAIRGLEEKFENNSE